MRKRALKEQRLDDASEIVIQSRIQTYEAETKPILDYFSDALRHNVDASQSPAKVLYDIIGKLQSLDAYQAISTETI